jgi:hypothetical protein
VVCAMSAVGLFQLSSEVVDIGVLPGGLFGSGFDPWYGCIGGIANDHGNVGCCMEGLIGTLDVAEV